MKIKEVSKINIEKRTVPIVLGKGPSSRVIELELSIEDIDKQLIEPTVDSIRDDWWLYKGNVLSVEGYKTLPIEEVKLRVKHFVLSKEKELKKITKEVEAFESFVLAQVAKRERIPDSVRSFVWQRDEGECVKCGKKEKLEFDHIIPVIEGGSNTERNIQLLCEGCNRSKGKKI
jgi:hypothetical protein